MDTLSLHKAAQMGHLDIFKLICEKVQDKIQNEEQWSDSQGITPLHVAASFGHFKIFEYFWGKVQDKYPQNYIGRTPLHCATQAGRVKICSFIIKNVNVNDIHPEDKDGRTPLDLADGHKGIEHLYSMQRDSSRS